MGLKLGIRRFELVTLTITYAVTLHVNAINLTTKNQHTVYKFSSVGCRKAAKKLSKAQAGVNINAGVVINTSIHICVHNCAMQRDGSKCNLPAGRNLRIRLGCSSGVAAAVCPTEPPARPEGERITICLLQ